MSFLPNGFLPNGKIADCCCGMTYTQFRALTETCYPIVIINDTHKNSIRNKSNLKSEIKNRARGIKKDQGQYLKSSSGHMYLAI